MTKELVCFDVETTGLNSNNGHIIQLSMSRFDSQTFEIVKEKNWYIKPELDYDIEKGAQDVHGITKDFLELNGERLRDIYPEIVEILGDCDVLTYNGNSFDIKFLYNDLKELGLSIDWNRKFYDAYTIECMRSSRKLVDVYRKYTGHDFEGAHDALCDVHATIEVFKHQLQYGTEELSRREFDVISPEGLLMYGDNGEVWFAHGKHSRRSVVDICKSDPSYIRWLFDNCSYRTKKTIMEEYYKAKAEEAKLDVI